MSEESFERDSDIYVRDEQYRQDMDGKLGGENGDSKTSTEDDDTKRETTTC